MSIYPFTVDAPRTPRAQRLLEDERGIVDDRSFWEVILRSFGGGLHRREWAKSAYRCHVASHSIPTAGSCRFY